MGISLKGFGNNVGDGATISGLAALPPQAAEVRLPTTKLGQGSNLPFTYDNVTETGWDIPYTIGDNYVYSQIPSTPSNGVDITAGIAALHQWIEITFSIPFTNAVDYTVSDNTKIEVVAGKAQFKAI